MGCRSPAISAGCCGKSTSPQMPACRTSPVPASRLPALALARALERRRTLAAPLHPAPPDRRQRARLARLAAPAHLAAPAARPMAAQVVLVVVTRAPASQPRRCRRCRLTSRQSAWPASTSCAARFGKRCGIGSSTGPSRPTAAGRQASRRMGSIQGRAGCAVKPRQNHPAAPHGPARRAKKRGPRNWGPRRGCCGTTT